jgi:predicted transposase YbfD/YdcC
MPVPDKNTHLTLSFDGKTICSTEKMDSYEKPLHIVSAQLAELGITLGQKTVNEKSNEIPAVRELIQLLNIEGCVVAADALNCQKETARAIIAGKGEYVFHVKGNQGTLERDIAEYVQDEYLRNTMDVFKSSEKNSGRIEKRTGYTSSDIQWLYGKEEWAHMASIGAVHREFSSKKGDSDEWHYYISSLKLSAEELLTRVRSEWSVESMHWLLDVHLGEDFCRVEVENVQQNLNLVRKIALNSIKGYKGKNEIKRPISKIMFDCLLDCKNLLPILYLDKN